MKKDGRGAFQTERTASVKVEKETGRQHGVWLGGLSCRSPQRPDFTGPQETVVPGVTGSKLRHFKKMSLLTEADLGVSHRIFYSLKKSELPSPGGMQNKACTNHPGGGRGILASGSLGLRS